MPLPVDPMVPSRVNLVLIKDLTFDNLNVVVTRQIIKLLMSERTWSDLLALACGVVLMILSYHITTSKISQRLMVIT